jgi:hypothetical protein
MRLLLVSFLVFIFNCSFGQQYVPFNTTRVEVDKKLMLGLGTWATTNFIASGIGWTQAKTTESQYFHQMNVMWNLVNIGLAIPGYVKASKARTDLTYEQTLQQQKKTEKIFLINTCLDVAYVSSGLLLLHKSKETSSVEQRQSGYGKSILLQGGFLFLFDLTAYLAHKTHGKALINSSIGSIGMSPTGIGLSWNIPPVTLTKNHRFL